MAGPSTSASAPVREDHRLVVLVGVRVVGRGRRPRGCSRVAPHAAGWLGSEKSSHWSSSHAPPVGVARRLAMVPSMICACIMRRLGVGCGPCGCGRIRLEAVVRPGGIRGRSRCMSRCPSRRPEAELLGWRCGNVPTRPARRLWATRPAVNAVVAVAAAPDRFSNGDRHGAGGVECEDTSGAPDHALTVAMWDVAPSAVASGDNHRCYRPRCVSATATRRSCPRCRCSRCRPRR